MSIHLPPGTGGYETQPRIFTTGIEGDRMTNEPADMLEAAAKKLRDLAGAATPGPWGFGGQGVASEAKPEPAELRIAITDFTPRDIRDLAGIDMMAEIRRSQRNGAYIAAMSPPVALAFAKLLDATARVLPIGDDGLPLILAESTYAHALDVARAILGPGWAMQRAAADLASIEQEDT